jgi:hypothetical protein
LNPAHLFLGTPADNTTDMIAKGRGGNAGETHGMAKLTREAVEDIRCRYSTGRVLQRELAEEYGVALMTISNVVRGASWR